MQKILFFLLALLLTGCGPESDTIRYWTLGSYFGSIFIMFLAGLIHRFFTRRHRINPLQCLANGFGLIGLIALCGSPFYGFALNSFSSFLMLSIMGITSLFIFRILDED